MNYSTWETSRWYIYDFGKNFNNIGILHLQLEFKIIDILDDIDKYIKNIIIAEEFKSGKKVTYKEKLDLKKQLKKVVRNYIKNRLEKGFEHELFTIK